MTPSEFEQWFRYHRSHFPAVDTMIDKVATGPEPLTRKEIKLAWEKTLRSCRLDDAKEATDALHAESDAGWPDTHPAKIAALCRKAQAGRRQAVSVYHDGQQAVLCQTCGDTGWVQCWHPGTLQKAKVGDLSLKRTCVYPCTCAAGDTRVKVFPECPRYDVLKMCAVLGGNEEAENKNILDWLAAYRKPRPKNYEPSFSGYEIP